MNYRIENYNGTTIDLVICERTFLFWRKERRITMRVDDFCRLTTCMSVAVEMIEGGEVC